MTLRIGTSDAGGTFHSQATAIAELFNKRASGQRCVVETTLKSLHDAILFETGGLEFGFTASNWVGRATAGAAPFARKIALRMVCPVNAGPIFFVTLADSPIETADDLRGKRIAIGPENGGMAEHVRTIFDVLGIRFDAFTPAYLGFAEAAAALVARDVDALLQRPIPNRVMTELSQRAEVRVVPYAPGQIEKIVSAVPFYRRITIAKKAFRGLADDMPQVGVVNVLVAHERVGEQAVHDLAATIIENLDALPRINPLFKGLRDLFEPLRSQGAAAFEMGNVPLHPGAIRAYREAGWLR